jgi:hypothetical protein
VTTFEITSEAPHGPAAPLKQTRWVRFIGDAPAYALGEYLYARLAPEAESNAALLQALADAQAKATEFEENYEAEKRLHTACIVLSNARQRDLRLTQEQTERQKREIQRLSLDSSDVRTELRKSKRDHAATKQELTALRGRVNAALTGDDPDDDDGGF